MDKNGDGRISADEVSTALGETGLSVGSQSLEDLIAADVPGSKDLTFDDFKVRTHHAAACCCVDMRHMHWMLHLSAEPSILQK